MYTVENELKLSLLVWKTEMQTDQKPNISLFSSHCFDYTNHDNMYVVDEELYSSNVIKFSMFYVLYTR